MAQFDRQGIVLHDLFWQPPAFGPIFQVGQATFRVSKRSERDADDPRAQGRRHERDERGAHFAQF
jgi:hypothetical protein